MQDMDQEFQVAVALQRPIENKFIENGRFKVYMALFECIRIFCLLVICFNFPFEKTNFSLGDGYCPGVIF